MASKYWEWKFRDVRPEEKVELTPRQKRRNWWHYHKWHVLLGAVGLIALTNLLLTVLGVGRTDPDYQFAYVAEYPLPDPAAAALEGALAALGEDCDGDGKVAVRLNQYTSGGGGGDNPYFVMAATTKIMADLSGRESYFFLMDDPQAFQRGYGALRRRDGAASAEGEADWESCCLKWTDCPALVALGRELSGEDRGLLENLYIARRGFWTEGTCDHVEACDAMWERMTEGAIS